MGTGELADDPTISDDQVIWRRINDAIPDDNLKRKRPSSACFLQDGPDGPVSVYIASEAPSAQVVMHGGKEQFLAALTVDFVRQLGLGVIRDSSSGGLGHALLLGRTTRSMRVKMAETATWVAPYAP